jgi:hypothetical protein
MTRPRAHEGGGDAPSMASLRQLVTDEDFDQTEVST